MAGESFFPDEVLGLIDPWHGLYRAADGMIEAANTVKTANKGTPPDLLRSVPTASASPSLVSLPDGSSMLVRIPGLPAPTTPAAELAAGRTWLNYNILAGWSQRLAGNILIGWIYIAADGSRWRVAVNPTASHTGTAGRVSFEIVLYRFGEFGSAAGSDPVQVINVASTSYAVRTALAGGLTFYPSTMLDDVTETGNKALYTVSHALGGAIPGRAALAVVELTLAGIPPSATATASRLAQDAGLTNSAPTPTVTYKTGYWEPVSGSYVSHIISGPTPGPNYVTPYVVGLVSGAASVARDDLIGARYSSQGAAELITLSLAASSTYTGDVTGGTLADRQTLYAGFTCTGSQSISGSAILKANGAALYTASWSFSANGTASGQTQSGPRTATFNGSSTSDNAGGVIAGGTPGGFGVFGFPVAIGDFLGIRYSNSLYGLGLTSPVDLGNPNSARTYWRLPVFGKLGSDNSIKVSASAAVGDRFATEHPVTGQIVRSDSGVCFL